MLLAKVFCRIFSRIFLTTFVHFKNSPIHAEAGDCEFFASRKNISAFQECCAEDSLFTVSSGWSVAATGSAKLSSIFYFP